MDYRIKRSEKWSIEPEETLLDRESADRLEYAQMETPIGKKNFAVLLMLLAVVFGVFLGKVLWMQGANHAQYRSLAESNRTRNYPVLAARGIIYDRHMTPLVENIPSFDVVAVPADLPREKTERTRVIREAALLLAVSVDELAEEFGRMDLSNVNPVVIRENVAREQALLLETRFGELPGIELKKNAARQYPSSVSLAHVVGYVGRVSQTDLAENAVLSSLDVVGKAGVEASYDSWVRGQNGVIEREIDAVSKVKKERQVREEAAGANIRLTIDADFQKKVFEVLSQTLANTPEATGAAAVALDPSTGAVRALASVPSYDSNIFSDTEARAKQYAKLVEDPARPFFSRAVSGLYPPGSSIKPFMALAALEEGVVTPQTQVVSTGAVVIENPYRPDMPAIFRDWKEGGHGVVNLARAIAESVNTYFFAVGGGYGDIKGLGIDRIQKYLKAFGFGVSTELDVPEERSGFVPDRSWKEQTRNERWAIGDTYNVSIGQGDVLVTPLQLAQAYAAIANGGKLIKPYIVESVFDKDKTVLYAHAQDPGSSLPVGAAHIETVRKALRETVTNGTAWRIADAPVAVAGKTGTAQAGLGKAHAWFSSFAPYNNPELVLVILIENGGEGSVVAAPAAREIYNWYFSRNKR